MGSNLPSFDRAQYVETPPPFDAAQESVDHSVFTKSILYGVGAAIVGCLVYAGFTIATHIQIGYLAWGVGLLVGKAMMTASENLGGRKYQVAAAVLTYFAVSMAASIEILWSLHEEGKTIHLSGRLIALLAGYGVASPFLELTDGFGGVIGLIILFAGIRSAWRMAAGTRHY